MIQNTLTIVSLSVILFGTYCLGSAVTSSWIKHSESVNKFKCLIPQPRSLELRELFENDDPLVINADTVFPSSTILHRCDGAGCCSGKKQCAEQNSENVELIFGIIQKDPPGINYIHKNVINHTLCTCVVK
ncbi:hypothetical protein WA026_022270 [Henosepilachna vigintioctopunctata]|uniref:Platelet-derived growth factor (PDGF) family profile domain-containing protein n=1 Tax=Henosepilachna vigintioctopunctata TaxID=420089 RepID=A0AAW1VGR6_9CUCU